jgi:hypothetical protein
VTGDAYLDSLERHQRILDRLVKASEQTAENTRRRPPERSRMSIRERVAYVREHGADAYLRLPWADR